MEGQLTCAGRGGITSCTQPTVCAAAVALAVPASGELLRVQLADCAEYNVCIRTSDCMSNNGSWAGSRLNSGFEGWKPRHRQGAVCKAAAAAAAAAAAVVAAAVLALVALQSSRVLLPYLATRSACFSRAMCRTCSCLAVQVLHGCCSGSMRRSAGQLDQSANAPYLCFVLQAELFQHTSFVTLFITLIALSAAHRCGTCCPSTWLRPCRQAALRRAVQPSYGAVRRHNIAHLNVLRDDP